MSRISLMVSLVLGIAFLAGCGPSPNTPAPNAPPASAIGRCAVDAKDGAPYGKIVAEETDLTTGEKMYKIEGAGGVSWNKKAANVKVVDCP